MNSIHPDDELLVAIAAGALDPNGSADAAIHVRSCTMCMAAIAAFTHRLPQQLPFREDVPVELVERAMLRIRDDPATAGPIPPPKVHRLGLRRSWGIALALAAGVVLWFGVQTRYSSDSHELDRDVAVTHVLHVKRPSLSVYVLPEATSAIAATLHRGDRVEILDKQGEWWKVAAAHNTIGWAMRRDLLSQ